MTQDKTPLVIAAIIGGFFIANIKNADFPSFNSKSKVEIIATKSNSDLDERVKKTLEGKTKKEHENLYKVFKGVSEYLRNSQKLKTTPDLLDSIKFVIETYNVDKISPELSNLVEKEIGIIKEAAKIVDSVDESLPEKQIDKNPIIDIFDKLADAVKYSAEQIREEK